MILRRIKYEKRKAQLGVNRVKTGTTSAGGARVCRKCAEGQYSNNGGFCTPCNPGHYSTNATSSCSACSSGTCTNTTTIIYTN